MSNPKHVDEKTGRAAVADLISRGARPDVAQKSVEHVARLQAQREPIEKPKAEVKGPEAPTFIERGDGVTDVSRPAGSFDWNPDTGAFIPLTETLKYRKPQPTTAEQAIYDAMLSRRWRLLMKLPDWKKKLMDAFFRAAIIEHHRIKSTGAVLEREMVEWGGPFTKHLLSKATDAMVDVANDSNRLFGDWMSPSSPSEPPGSIKNEQAANPFVGIGGRASKRLPWLKRG